MELRAMHKCAVFLIAMVACSHLVFSVEGRKMKSGSKTANFALHKEDHQRGAPGYTPNTANHSVSGKKKVLPVPIPTTSSDFGDSITGYKDDFRPTTPGHSPGVGQYFGDDDDIVQKPGSISSSNDKHSIAGEKEGFRTTNAGPSDGAGHAFPSKYSEPTAKV